jgi:hypothetical protein
MTRNAVPVIAIDGPSASGKGTIAQLVARRLGFHYLDSGALYRLVGLAARRAHVNTSDEMRVARLAKDLDVRFDNERDLFKSRTCNRFPAFRRGRGGCIRSRRAARGQECVAVAPARFTGAARFGC